MPVIATDTPRLSNWLKYEFEPSLSYCREAIVINDPASATYKMGLVLGKITASGKYRQALSASSDGSQTPVGFLMANGSGVSSDMSIVAATDTNALMLARGPAFIGDTTITLGTGITLSAVRTACAAMNPPIQVVAVL